MKTTNQEMNPLFGLSQGDAIDMLIADHKRVANLFADFKDLVDKGTQRAKSAVVERICQELSVHTDLEETLFYPAVRKATGAEDQLDEAMVEHASAKSIIAQLQSASPDDDYYNAKVTVLGEQINHHVEEEEGSMFPKARYSGLDMEALGEQMLTRKAALQPANGTGLPLARQAAHGTAGLDGEPSPKAAAKRAKTPAAPIRKSKTAKAKPRKR